MVVVWQRIFYLVYFQKILQNQGTSQKKKKKKKKKKKLISYNPDWGKTIAMDQFYDSHKIDTEIWAKNRPIPI